MGGCTSGFAAIFGPKKPQTITIEPIARTTGSIRENFILIRSLGSGSLGSVFLVKDKRTGLERAAKEMIKSLMKETAMDSYFELLSRLKNLVLSMQDHPNVLKVYEVVETSSRFYLITEFLNGGQLFERISRSPKINEKIAARYLFEIMLALDTCHKNGIIHREIKPENLLFESDAPDAHLKMIDFDVGSLLKDPTGDIKYPIGSVAYMPPERFTGITSSKSDIWSAGVILFVILSGTVPIQGKTDADTIKKIVETEVSLSRKVWDNISEDAKSLLTRMLTRDPVERMSAEDVLNDTWMFALTKGTISDTELHIEAVTNLQKFHVRSM